MTQSRRDWSWGVASSPAETERLDEEWWLELTPSERMVLVYELSASFEWSDDEQDDVPRRALGAACGARSAGG